MTPVPSAGIRKADFQLPESGILSQVLQADRHILHGAARILSTQTPLRFQSTGWVHARPARPQAPLDRPGERIILLESGSR